MIIVSYKNLYSYHAGILEIGMNFQQFERIFKPRSIAVVGASSNPSKMGTMFLMALHTVGFPALYPVNPHEREILGLKAYPSVRDIPEEVDYALISVPADKVAAVVEDCVSKGVNAVAIYTSGFSEFNDEGREKEKTLVKIADGKVRILGPNCLGAFCLQSKLNLALGSVEEGEVSFISQSGGNVETVANLARKMGVGFSKVVSYGNACDLNGTDFIEYFGEDPETKIIIMYVEGVKDGKRFVEVTAKVSKTKPVIILRGGTTQGGSKAAASHTGSLCGSNDIWNAVFKQTGAIEASSVEELLATASAFTHIPKLNGKNVGMVGIGGGAGVMAVDECEKSGLSLPTFSPETIDKLGEIVPPIGTSIKNPIDLSSYAQFNPPLFGKAVEIVSKDSIIDGLILLYHNMSYIPGLLQEIERTTLDKDLSKPAIAVLEPAIEIEEIKEGHLRVGVPVYNNLAHAAKALCNVATYCERVKFLKKHAI